MNLNLGWVIFGSEERGTMQIGGVYMLEGSWLLACLYNTVWYTGYVIDAVIFRKGRTHLWGMVKTRDFFHDYIISHFFSEWSNIYHHESRPHIFVSEYLHKTFQDFLLIHTKNRIKLLFIKQMPCSVEVLGRRMSIQKMLRKRIPLHPSWNYIIFTWINR
jgi:hypothetical protein